MNKTAFQTNATAVVARIGNEAGKSFRSFETPPKSTYKAKHKALI